VQYTAGPSYSVVARGVPLLHLVLNTCSHARGIRPKSEVAVTQVPTGILAVTVSHPKGGAAAAGTGREESMDCVAGDLLAKARPNTLPD